MVPSGFRRFVHLGFINRFSKKDIGWPQQPLTERVSDISERLDFDNLFHKKGLVVVIWVLGMIKPSGSVNFLMK